MTQGWLRLLTVPLRLAQPSPRNDSTDASNQSGHAVDRAASAVSSSSGLGHSGSAGGGGHNLFGRSVRRGKSTVEPSIVENQNAVGAAQQFGQFGTDKNHSFAIRRKLINDAINVLLRRDVDSPGRVVQ